MVAPQPLGGLSLNWVLELLALALPFVLLESDLGACTLWPASLKPLCPELGLVGCSHWHPLFPGLSPPHSSG